MADGQAHAFLESRPSTAKDNAATTVRAIDRRSLPANQVTNLDIDVTEACNLACTYCFKGELYSQHMSIETLKACYDWLESASGDAESMNFNFMGGEPVMRWKQVREFAVWARNRGRARGKRVTFSMTSNLTLWNDDVRSFVDELGFGVLMSIDGCPEVQDAQRPAKNGKAMSGIIEKWAKSMLTTRPGSTARMTVSPTYVDRLFDSVAYLHGIGFREVTTGTADYGSWDRSSFETFANELDKIVDYSARSLTGDRPLLLTVMKYQIHKVIRHRAAGDPERIEHLKSPCGAGKGYMMVDYTGDIWPCHRFDGADADANAQGAFRLGNIGQPGFHHELQQAFLQFDHTKYRKPACDTCPCDPTCGGFCPAANLADSGNIHTPHDNYCKLSQMLYEAGRCLHERAVENGTVDRLLALCDGVDGDGR